MDEQIQKQCLDKIISMDNDGKSTYEICEECVKCYNVDEDKILYIINKKRQMRDYPFTLATVEDDYNNNIEVRENPKSCMSALLKKLKSKNIYSEKELNDIKENSYRINNKLSYSYKKHGVKKGLVMGYVQSGKTTSMEGLIAAAIDAGVNLVIVLSGTIENLRIQTLNRLKSDFKIRMNDTLHFENRVKEDELLRKTKGRSKIITVCLKNASRLKTLRDMICDSVVSSTLNVLVIDDEADQASLNSCYSSKERTRINEYITDIVNYEDFNSINYVGYTATPYGNFLNEYGEESLYPKNFICMLPKSTKYIGPSEIFGESDDNSLNIVRTITKDEIKLIKEIENDERFDIPPDLKKSIAWFVCTVATARYNKAIKPVSMLIHTSQKLDAHENLYKSIVTWIKDIKIDEFIRICKNVYDQEIKNLEKEDFYNVMVNYDIEIKDYIEFNKLIPYIYEIIEDIKPIKIQDDSTLEYHKHLHIVVDNSNARYIDNLDEDDHIRLVYPNKDYEIDFAPAFIIIGGNTLSRGLTIEGLTTTYFTRNSGLMDTLMQMGRWFGYRIGYELMPRIWMSEIAMLRFMEITKVEEELRKDLYKYQGNSDLTPELYGPRILNSSKYKLKITSKNKMQAAKVADINFESTNIQTTFFENDESILKHNIDATEKLIEKLPSIERSTIVKTDLVSKKVDFNIIKEYLEEYKTNERNSSFEHLNILYEWVEKNQIESYKKWNVIFSGVEITSNNLIWNIKGNEIGKVSRSRKNRINTCIDIGVLTNTESRISDLSTEYKDLAREEKYLTRNKIIVPQLVIYRIDKNSIPRKNTYARLPLDAKEDIIGINIYIPGNTFSSNQVYVTVDMPEVKNEGEE